MQYANNDGVRLAYERAGPTDAPTVVFVEGLGYGRWMWRWQRRALEDDYDTIVWDNRGTGDSDAPTGPYTTTEMASDLAAVLNAADVGRAHVVGASMGGMIAQQFALEYDRTRSLTLMCTSPGGPETRGVPDETAKRLADVPEAYDEREARRYRMAVAMSESFMAENDALVERIVDWRLASDPSERALGWQRAAVEAFDVHDRLEEIQVPALVMHGTADRVVPHENGALLAAGLPTAEFVTFEGAPHLFFIERHEAVTDRLGEFLPDG